MKERMKKYLSILTAAAVLLGGIQMPAAVKAQENVDSQAVTREAITVETTDQFMQALREKKSPITVSNSITVDNGAESDGRMRPVYIPAGTVIQGSGELNFRCPVQLDGDGVCFKNIKVVFESTNALESIPQREIFLAGHSLTLDNVDTYLEGGDGEYGGLTGTEKELLPTIYAGGYKNTTIGSGVSLTVENSNDKTMFQAIYMGHDAENDNKVPYMGNATVNLDAKAVVREGVDTSLNTKAEINIAGEKNQVAKATEFYGNENTTLTVDTLSVEEASVNTVGNVVLQNGSCLSPKTGSLQNVTLKDGSCLDFYKMRDVVITGNFTGEQDANKKGILVLYPDDSLTIEGEITGITQFQTYNRLFPGQSVLLKGWNYIHTNNGNGSEQNFVLPQEKIDQGYELSYLEGVWSIAGEPEVQKEIGKIEVLSAPSKVDLRKIVQEEDGIIPDENTYFEVRWYDTDGNVFENSEVEYYMFYEMDYVIRIRTDYWESTAADVLDKQDWYQWVNLVSSETYPDRYFLRAYEKATPGDYTFLFCSVPFEGNLNTVADVKALKDTVMAEQRVIFYDQDTENPEHTHSYQSAVTKKATCTEKGIKTYTCSCGDKYTEEIAATGHKEVVDPEVKPTETTAGKTEGSHCSVCGEIIKRQEEIPALGKPAHTHSYQSAVTKKATCTEKGIKTYTCSCGDKYTEEIAATGHKAVIEPAVAPTETTAGKTEGSHCSVCGRVLKVPQSIPALGKPAHTHSYQSAVTKKATSTKKGVITYTCGCGHKYTKEIASPNRKFTMNKTDFTYDGKVKTPSVTVKDSKGKSLKKDTDYKIKYPKGRKNPGVYTVTVEFRGNYSGKLTGSFTIKPKKTSLKKVTAKSKGMQVTWNKQKTQIDGYQIQYCTSGKFKGKTLKTATAKKNDTSKKISKLKGKKKYYVRIRTYKTVKVNGKSKKLYSDWSGKKTVNTKK